MQELMTCKLLPESFEINVTVSRIAGEASKSRLRNLTIQRKIRHYPTVADTKYKAIIAKIRVTQVKDAKTIASGNVEGYSVIVDKDTADGTLGIYFPAGGQLSHEFCMANNLYREHPETGAPMGGYLDANRRVKTLRFMGIESEGLFLPIHALSYLVPAEKMPTTVLQLQEGDKLCEFAGKTICKRYDPPFAKYASGGASDKAKKLRKDVPGIPRHFDTGQLRMNLRSLRIGDRLIFSEKLHGTSGVTGKVREAVLLPWYKRLLNLFARAIGADEFYQTKRVAAYSRTRNCLLDPNADPNSEKAAPYRMQCHNRIAGLLRINEIVYYEIVGYAGFNGKPIMPVHAVPEKLQKRLGKLQEYSYGCSPTGETADGTVPLDVFRIFVYRIVDNGRDLLAAEMIKRCQELGLEVCPTLCSYKYDGDSEFLQKLCEGICNGKPPASFPQDFTPIRQRPAGIWSQNSTLDNSHIREGVCVRVERQELLGSPGNSVGDWYFVTTYKYKSWNFCHLEEIRPNSDTEPDAEELASAEDE